MKVTPAKRMLKRAARAKLMVSSARTSCRGCRPGLGDALGGQAVQGDQDQPDGDAGDGGDGPEPGQGGREAVGDGVGDGDQAAQHEDQAEDDGQVIGDPEPAAGDRAGDAFGVPDGSCRMEEVADQPQQGAGYTRVRPDAQDPPCGCGGGGHHRSLPAG
jgi:hypothetical protein